MDTEENKAIVQRLNDNLFNRRHLALADELIAADCLHHTAPPGTPRGPEGMRRVIAIWRASWPDRRHTIEDVIAEGDIVAVRLTVSGTTTGRPRAGAPQGRRATQVEVHILRLAGGQITDYWAVPGQFGPARRHDGGVAMPILRIEHPVSDFAGWKAAFASDPVGRERSGVRRYQIFRALDDPNYVMIDLVFDTASEAEALLAAMQAVWKRVDGSVMANPRARIVEIVESVEY